MKCPQCAHDNRRGATWCESCGASLELRCVTCGHVNAAGSRFCNDCGQPLGSSTAAPPRFGSPVAYTPKHLAEKILGFKSAVEGERKQVTVLFCDIVDSTSLLHRLGPEAMHGLLNDFFELVLGEVHRYEGTINQFLGDGFMALFGAPIAYEDHARRGVLAAWAIHRRLQEQSRTMDRSSGAKLSVRMGLNTGAVVVGKIGDNLRMDYTAVGDTTHLAARFQQAAEPGTIVMSEATFRLVRSMVTVDRIEALYVKGTAEPISAYRLTGLSPRRAQRELVTDALLSPFVGRDHELRALHEAFDRASDGHGCVVSFVGEPGAGKSRLLLEFQRTLTGKPVAYVEGRCLSYGTTVPYLPLLDHVRGLCGIGELDSREVVADKVRSTLRDVGIETEAAPYILHLFSLRSDPDVLAPLTPAAIRARTFQVLRQLALHSSARRPLVFVVEDLHWIDRTSDEYLATLARVVRDARILLVTTCRPGHRSRWLERSSALQLALPGLSDEDSLTVIRSILASEAFPADVTQRILQRAEGNPLFLEELARTVREHRDLVIPETVEALLTARIDRLSQDAKQLLQCAAVLGRAVSRPLLEAVWQGPIDAAVAELKRLEFVHEMTTEMETRYVFKHALIQEVAYETLLSPQRQALHAAAARALEHLYAGSLEDVYDRLAYHYARTDQTRKAVEYLTRFARRAARGYSHAEAAAALAEALTHARQLPEGERDAIVLDLVLRQVQSLNFLGRNQESLMLLLAHKERLDRVADAAQSCRYHFALGLTYNFLGDRDGSAENVQRALDEAERASDDRTTGRACALLALESHWSGRPHEGLQRGRRALALLERTQQPYWLAQAHFYMAINYYLMGALDLALEAATRADTVGQAVGDLSIRSYAASTAGGIHAAAGRFEAAMASGQRGLDLAPDPLARAQALGFFGYVFLEQGNAARAIPLLRDAAEQMGQFRYRQLQGWFTALLGESTLLAGDPDGARDLLSRGLELTGQAKYWLGVGWAQRGLGRLARATGDAAAARDRFVEALDTFRSVDAEYEVARTELALAELAATAGDARVASEHLRAAHRRFRDLDVGTYVDRAEHLAAAIGVSLPHGA